MSARRLTIWGASGLSLITSWVLIVFWLGPRLIGDAYSHRSYEFLNRAIVGQDKHEVEFYLRMWYQLVAETHVWVLGFVILLVALRYLSSQRGFERVVGRGGADSLGGIRVVVFAILLFDSLWEDLASIASLPMSMIRPVGVMA